MLDVAAAGGSFGAESYGSNLVVDSEGQNRSPQTPEYVWLNFVPS